MKEMTTEIAEKNGVVAAQCCQHCSHYSPTAPCKGDCSKLGCWTFATDVCNHYHGNNEEPETVEEGPRDWEYYEVDFFRVMPENGKRPIPYGAENPNGEEFADADYSLAIRAKHKPTIEEAEEWLKSDIAKFHEAGVLQVVGPVDEEEIRDCYDMRNKANWPIFG